MDLVHIARLCGVRYATYMCMCHLAQLIHCFQSAFPVFTWRFLPTKTSTLSAVPNRAFLDHRWVHAKNMPAATGLTYFSSSTRRVNSWLATRQKQRAYDCKVSTLGGTYTCWATKKLENRHGYFLYGQLY